MFPTPKTTYIGIDNGVTGSIGWLRSSIDKKDEGIRIPSLIQTPVINTQDYQKTPAKINRIDHRTLKALFEYIFRVSHFTEEPLRVIIERPFIAPNRFKQIASGMRALEATLISLELAQEAYPSVKMKLMFTDVREWRKILGFQGKAADTKVECQKYGEKHFPGLKGNSKDYDGLLIALAFFFREGGTLEEVHQAKNHDASEYKSPELLR